MGKVFDNRLRKLMAAKQHNPSRWAVRFYEGVLEKNNERKSFSVCA